MTKVEEKRSLNLTAGQTEQQKVFFSKTLKSDAKKLYRGEFELVDLRESVEAASLTLVDLGMEKSDVDKVLAEAKSDALKKKD